MISNKFLQGTQPFRNSCEDKTISSSKIEVFYFPPTRDIPEPYGTKQGEKIDQLVS